MELIGHRGCAAIYPENTALAMERAAERLPAIEVDVRRCASGELVCVHDATVGRVTEGSGQVDELRLDELRALDVQASGEPIPTLSDVLDAIPESVTAQIELKEPGLGADVLDCPGLQSSARLSSFEPAVLREVCDADIPIGYLFGKKPVENIALARELDCSNVHPHWRLCADSEVVDLARDHGLGVYAWGAKSNPEAVAAACDAGVDGVTVDRPDL